MNIKDKENRLFEEWIEHEKEWLLKENYFEKEEDVFDLFCYDGLHHTGIADKSQDCWLMEPDNKEEDLWNNQLIKPIFLTKDHNLNGDEEGVDVRLETGLDNVTDKVYYQFYARYLILLYGINHVTKEGEFPTFEEASIRENYLRNFHSECAVVRINMKKIAGGAYCYPSELEKYISHDEAFIRKQLQLTPGNVYICCDGSDNSPILRFLLSEFKDATPIHYKGEEYNYLYYSHKHNIVIIHEWHMSNRVKYKTYYQAVYQLARFIKENPDFLS